MLDIFWDIIYPPVCGSCGKLDTNSLCKKCEKLLKSQAVFGIDNYTCDFNKYFDEHLYIFMYSGVIRKILLDYKFNDNSYLYKTFTNFLLKNEKFVENIKSYDIIIPVPLSSKRKKERGYNQSELIAREISNKTKLELMKKILIKQKNNTAQSNLDKEARLKNVQGAYKLKNTEKIKNKKALLVDDIFTTGSTANACSEIIKKLGIPTIGILTIAKD